MRVTRSTAARAARRPLAALALAVTVVTASGCGSQGTDPAAGSDRSGDVTGVSSTAPGSAPPSTPGSEDGEPGEPVVVDLISISAAGGSATTSPSPVSTPAELTAYVGEFAVRAGTPLTRAIADAAAPTGTRLTATVIDVGCTPPTEVTITPPGQAEGETWAVAAAPATSGKAGDVQCLVPVTTVALVALPA